MADEQNTSILLPIDLEDEMPKAHIAQLTSSSRAHESLDFLPNLVQTREEPAVLPSLIPNPLVNPPHDIAVGMATNIPPHNLRYIADPAILLIEKPDTT